MDWGERVGSGHTADIFALGEDRVLKRFRPGTDPATVRREAASARAAAAAGLPVPAVREVTEAAGRPAIVYERVRGPTMRSRLARRPWAVRRYARLLAALHASIHAARPAGVPSLRDRLSRNVEAAPGLSAAARRRARSMLASLPRGRALCHGDFHPENVLLAERGPVVVDWLDAARGPPAADVARTALLLRYAGGEAGPLGAAVRRAFRWWYLRAYCARGGRPPGVPLVVPPRLLRSAGRLPVADPGLGSAGCGRQTDRGRPRSAPPPGVRRGPGRRGVGRSPSPAHHWWWQCS